MAERHEVQAILSAEDKNFTSTFEKAFGLSDKFESKLSSGIGFGVLTGIGQKAVDLVCKGISTMSSHLDSAIKRVDTLENYPKVMQSLGYSTEQASAAMKVLDSGIQDLPTTMDEIVKNSQLLTATLGDIDKGSKSAVALNHMFLAGGQGADAASRALVQYNQILAKGKVDQQSWNTMVEVAPAQMNQLAKSLLGAEKNQRDLYAALLDGKISIEDFNDAIIRLDQEGGEGFNSFSEQALASVDGIGTKMTNLGTAVTKGMANCIQATNEMLERNGLPTFQEMLDTTKGGINSFFGALKEGIGSINNLPDILKNAGSALRIVAAASAAVSLPSVFSKATPIIQKASGAVKLFASNLGGGIVGKVGALSSKLKGIKLPSGISKAVSKLGGGFSTLGGKIKNVVAPADSLRSKLAKGLGKIVGGTGKAITGVTKLGANMTKAVGSSLMQIPKIALKALSPAIMIGAGLVAMGALYNTFGDQIDNILNLVTTKGPEIISNLVSSLTSKIPELMKCGTQLLTRLIETITTMLPVVLQAGYQIVEALIQGVISNFPAILSAGLGLIEQLSTSIITGIPKLVLLGMDLLIGLIDGILDNLPQIVSTATNIIDSLTNAISTYLPQIIDKGCEILLKLAQGIVQALPQIIVAGIQAITQLITTISGKLPQIIQTGVQIIQMLIQGIVTNLPAILGAAAQAISALIQGIGQNLPNIIQSGFQIITMLINGLGQALPTILAAGWDIIKSLAKGIWEAIPGVLSAVVDGVKGIFTNLWSLIKGDSDSASKQVVANTQEMASSFETTAQGMLDVATVDYTAAMSAVETSSGSMANSIVASSGTIATTATSNIEKYSKNAEKSLESTAKSSAKAAKNMSSNITDATSKISSTSSSSWSGMTNGANSAFRGMASSAKTSMSAVQNTVKSSMNNVKNAVMTGMKGAVTAMRSSGSQMASALRGASGSVGAAGRTVAMSGVTGIRSQASAAYTAGANFGQGYANGIRAKISAVSAAAAAMARTGTSTLNRTQRSSSPSRLTTQSGEHFGEGYEIGILEWVGKVARAAEKLVTVPSISAPQLAYANGLALGDYEYNGNRTYEFEVSIPLNGRELARETITFIEDEQGRMTAHNNRKAGIR